MFPSIYQLNHSCFSHLLLACGLLLVVLLFVHLPLSLCTAVFISPQSLCAPPPSLYLSLSLPLCLHHSNSHLRSPLFFRWPPPPRSHTHCMHTNTLTCSLICPPPPVPILLALNLHLPPSPQIYLTSSSSWDQTALSHSPMPLCSLTSSSFPLHQHHHRN